MAEQMTNKDIVLDFYSRVWNRRDEVFAHSIIARDFTFCGSLGTEMRGIDAFLAYARDIHRALAGYHCRVDELVIHDQRAAARAMFSGLHRDTLLGFAPTGREVSWAGAAFFTFEHGRIARLWVLGDKAALIEQLAS